MVQLIQETHSFSCGHLSPKYNRAEHIRVVLVNPQLFTYSKFMTFEGTHSYLKPTILKKKKVRSPFEFENNLICERQSVVMTDWVTVFIIVVKKYLAYLLSRAPLSAVRSEEKVDQSSVCGKGGL